MAEQLLHRRATAAPAVATGDGEPDSADGIFEALLATPTPVLRSGVRPDGTFGQWEEVLDIAGANLSRAVGGPVLLDHKREAREQVGVIEHVRVEPGVGVVAGSRFTSGPLGIAYAKDVAEGTRRQTSAGYSVQEWERAGGTRAVPRFIARKWTLHEASIVALGADANARFIPATARRAAAAARSIINEGTQRMFGFNLGRRDDAGLLTRDGAPAAATADTGPDHAYAVRAAQFAAQRGLGDMVPLLLAREHSDDELNGLARAVQNVTRSAASLGVDPGAGRRVLAEGGDVNEAVAALGAVYANKPAAPAIRTAHMGDALGAADGGERALIVNGLTNRLSNGAVPLTPGAERFRSMRLDDLRDFVDQRRGLDGFGYGQRAAGITHSTTDFPSLLQDAGQRTVLALVEQQAPALTPLARAHFVADYRTISRLGMSEHKPLDRLLENGEVKYTTASENVQKYVVKSFGNMMGVSHEAIVNDDTGLLSDYLDTFARGAVALKADLLAAPLTTNPVMTDGFALFSAQHKNLAAASALTIAGLNAARLLMRTQTNTVGNFVDVAPRFLVVGPALEGTAEALLTTIAAATVETANVFAGKLVLIVEPRLGAASTDWFLFADPARAPVIEFAELDGTRRGATRGPQVLAREGWNIRGIEVRCTYDCGLGIVGHVGAVRVPGV